MRISLLGFYARGNFGDDLYAVILGRHLMKAGHDVAIYGLCDAYAKPFGLQTVHAAGEFLRQAGAVLWGGGGLLVNWPGLLHQIRFPGAARELGGFVAQAVDRGIRVAACSVGGDGSCPGRLNPGYKERFASAAEFMTVRNPQDLAVLGRLGVPGAYYPDLIWLAGEQFPQPRRAAGGLRIAFDLYPGALLWNCAPHLIAILQALVWERRDCQFHFLDSANRSCRPYRGLGGLIRGANAAPHQFSDLESDLRFLASLDLLVSSRLHAPMLALQYGVPVISLLAERKTSLLFANLGLSQFALGRGRIREFHDLLRSRQRLDALLRDFPFPAIQRLRAQAAGHLRYLDERLDRPGGC